ncbi:MAG: carbohydrate ABC transporter permease [Anaerolineae bacterium]|nr:carbohydrate ABC transporter permease [Anaerolineae bacterium]NUQ03673.1 carbohydrate ABC transporter permease [Anaerolineae bacterium]
MKKSSSPLAVRLSEYAFYLPVLVFFFGPISWLLLASINSDPSSAWQIPVEVTLNNYVQLITESDLLLWMGNSMTLAIGTMAVTVVLSTLAAYPLSRVPFPGKAVFMYALLLARVMPITAVIIPIFSLAVQLSLVNTFAGAILILSAMQLPISLWIMKNFVDSIPVELEESAWLDGCNRLTGLIRIVFPLMSPGVAVTGLFAFLAAWGDFLIPLIILRSPNTFPIAMGLYRAFGDQGSVNFGFLTALSVLYSVPSIALYLFARQYLVKGMTAGGVKM